MSVDLPAGAALSKAGYPNPALELEVRVDTFTGSTLEALALSDVEYSPALDFATTRQYAASVGNEVVATEVTATPTVAGATVEILPADADPGTTGHQVALAVGDTTVKVTVKDAYSPDLVSGGSVNKSWQQTYEVVITRAPAKVSLARTDDVQNVEEGEPAPFTLTRIGDQTQPLVVFVEVEGEAWLSPGTWPTAVTIPAGATVHDFTVQTEDDDVERDNGAITVRVLAGSEYEVTDADAGEASIEINDNDTRSLVLSRSSLEVSEAGSASYTVKLVSQPSADVTVAIAGHSGTDLTLAPASASLTFTTSNWATAQTVVVEAAPDDDATHDSATLTHTASGGGYDSVTRELPVAVTDTTRVQLAAVVEDVPEGGSRPIRAMLPMPLDEDVTITVAVVPNDGTDGGRADEYELSANTTLTIAAGTTESTGAVTFTSLDDSDYTGTRLFDATLTPGHPRVDADTAEIAVVDDDNTIIGWIVNPSTIFENGGEATLRAFKTELNQGVVKMALSLEPSDRAALSGTTLTFQPGAIYAAETLTITAVDNTADEPDQTITISATVTEGRGVRTPEPQELTIVDDDNMSPDVALVLTPSQVREGLVSTVTAVASGPLDDEATITVSASPGHADTRTDDYVLSANTVLTIPAGGTRSTRTVTIATVDDPLSGGSRTREVTVSGAVTGGGGAADPDDQTLTILEDDRQVLLDLVATPATITEGEVSTITLHAFQPVPADVTVTVEHSHDAAELSANPVLMIAAGQTDSTGVVTLTALQDGDITPEVVQLRGTPSDDSQFVSVNYGAQVIIIDDDDFRDAQVLVTPAPTQVFEGGTSTFIANLSQPLSDEVTVTVSVDEAHPDHTAAADHFTLSANRTLTISAGSTHSTGVVTLTASNDEYYYGPGSRTVVLDFSATGIDQKRIFDYNTWIILEDEAQPRVTLSVAPASIAENGGQSMVAASLNTIVESDVEVTVTTAPVVAAEADDFTQSAALLTIPAGRKNSTGNVTINAVDDAIDGPDKHFVVHGTVEVVGMEQSGLVWFPYAEGLTIRDDDEAHLVLSTSSLGVAEGSSNTYTVALGSQPTAEVTVDITGHSRTDLTLDPASASLTFTTSNWSEAQTVTVEADHDDDAVDDTETLVHRASGGGYDAVTGNLPVTVTEDDTAQVTGVMLTAGDARLEVEWTAVANATGYKVQWKSGGQDYDPATRQATVSSGSTTSHQIDSLANGTEYTVQVIAVRSGANDGPPSDEVMGTPKVPNTSAVGLPMITGTAEVGETLTAVTSGITDVDGLMNVSYRYRWIRVDGSDETDIADATDSTYVLVTDDAGATLKVEVTFTDDANHDETLVSAPTQVIQDLRPYVTLAKPNSYHVDTLGLGENEATGRPVTLVVVFSAEVTGLEAEEFVIENGEVTDVYWMGCLRNPGRVRWCIDMQPADAPGERMTLAIPEDIADGGNQPAPALYYAVLSGTAPTGTFTTAAVEPVRRDFLALLTFDQDMLEDAPGTETLVFPEEEYLKSTDFVVPDEAVARITLDGFTHADDGSTIEVRIYPPGLLFQEYMSVVLPAGAALSKAGYPNPALELEVRVDTFTGSTLEALALTDVEFAPALDFATTRQYAASVGNEVVATEVTATPTVADATVEILPADADPGTTGHQVALAVGDTTVKVTVKDAYSPDLVSGGSVNKSWQQTYEVVITRAPAKVSLARTDDVQNVEEGEPAPFTLTRIGDQTQPLVVFVEVAGAEWLSPGTWPTEVTIPAGATAHEFTVQTEDDDAERDNGAVTVRVLQGSEYELTDADAGEASIRIHDNDTRSLLLSHSSLEVPEAGSASYTVKLATQPSADVTVAIAGHAGTDLTLAPASASLTFTTLNWATAQTVVVSAVPDDDTTNDSATLTHTASGGNYDSLTQDLPVTILDAGNAATGQPEIDGTARVGETLTATIGTIADDVDGLPTGPFPIGYDFQWVRVDASDNETDIGTNSNNYTLMDADIGSTIRVEVSFTDSAGNVEEPLVSDAYPANGTVLAGGGICDRTAEVRNHLLGLISEVSDCAEVTNTHLAEVTGALVLSSNRISTLKAGDFAGLNAVSFLYLNGNNLMTLPLGVFDGLDALALLDLRENDLGTLPEKVFDGLDALTGLSLQSNGLATLPADLFDGLDVLSTLSLNDNDLATLPADLFDGLDALSTLSLNDNDLATLRAGVFEPLIALTQLRLQRNPGAPFSPMAVAKPDNGTVPITGGEVTLDGSGSDGGPWGTNVTYGWALTDPTDVVVTFDDAASAKPVVTIPTLTPGAELTFTLTVTGRATVTGEGTETATDTATMTAPDELGLVLSTDSLGVTEGSSDTYTVKLATQPTAQVTVTITGHADTDLTLAPASASLTFTADDWDTAQTVTVEAGEDDDAAGDTETLLHTATGGGYDSVTKDLGVTVTDNDEARLALSKAARLVVVGHRYPELLGHRVVAAAGRRVQQRLRIACRVVVLARLHRTVCAVSQSSAVNVRLADAGASVRSVSAWPVIVTVTWAVGCVASFTV